MKDPIKLIPLHVSEPFKGITTIVHISKEGKRISFNNLPTEYMPEVEKLILKLNLKFGRRLRKFVKDNPQNKTP